MIVKRLAPLLGLLLVVACQTQSNTQAAPTSATPPAMSQQQAMSLMMWYNHAISDSRW
jgi:uncharacterized lipoprotein YajG